MIDILSFPDIINSSEDHVEIRLSMQWLINGDSPTFSQRFEKVVMEEVRSGNELQGLCRHGRGADPVQAERCRSM